MCLVSDYLEDDELDPTNADLNVTGVFCLTCGNDYNNDPNYVVFIDGARIYHEQLEGSGSILDMIEIEQPYKWLVCRTCGAHISKIHVHCESLADQLFTIKEG